MGDAGSLVFFVVMRTIIRDRIDSFMVHGLERMYTFVGAIALTMVTLWIMIQGYRIMTGENNGSLMAFVVRAAKLVVILSVAMSGSIFGSKINDHIQDFQREITYIVTGENKDVYTMVDQNLLKMQVIIGMVNSLTAAQQQGVDDDKAKALWMTTFGTAGPAVIAGTMSLLNEIAMALAVMFGPLFILALMFENTKSLFWNWLRYTVAVMFSMAVLAMMTGIALKISYAYAAAMATAMIGQWANILVGGATSASISSTAMQQGGLGLLLSTLLLTVPPMVMQFFSVSLGGAVTGWSAFTPGKDNNPLPGQPGSNQRSEGTTPESSTINNNNVRTTAINAGGVSEGGVKSADSNRGNHNEAKESTWLGGFARAFETGGSKAAREAGYARADSIKPPPKEG